MGLKELFEALLVFEEPGKVLVRAHLPGHVATGPEAGVAVAERLPEGVGEIVDHAVDVEPPVHQMVMVGLNDEIRRADLLRRIDPCSREVGLETVDQRAAIEIEAAVVLSQLLANHGRHRRQVARRRTLVDQALMAGWLAHCSRL
jgi:protein-disulfide isomerase-like protein with CxxC motif